MTGNNCKVLFIRHFFGGGHWRSWDGKVKREEPRVSKVALFGQREALRVGTFWSCDFAPSAGGLLGEGSSKLG